MQTLCQNMASSKLEWLAELKVRANSVADFGCGFGHTLALMQTLGASEAVGIDRCKSIIRQDCEFLDTIQQCFSQFKRRLQSHPHLIPEHEKTLWETLPSFFKQDLLREDFRVEFCVEDITERTKLRSNYYDIAFCERVLEHIEDQDGGRTGKKTQSTIEEMSRVVKPGGYVGAWEHSKSYTTGQPLDFQCLFEEAGLERVHTEEGEHHKVYLYQKPINQG